MGVNSTQQFPGGDYIAAEQVSYLGETVKVILRKIGFGKTNLQPTCVSEANPLPTGGGNAKGTVASAAANTVIKASSGQLCQVLVTTAGTGTGSVLIYDNATTNSGTIIGVVPATIAVGTLYSFNMPASAGIVVANVASGPVLTVSYF